MITPRGREKIKLKYESGNTPLVKIRELNEKYNIDLRIKDESKNPFGTHKDRRSELIMKLAVRSAVNRLVLITSGNAGYSLGCFAKSSGVKVTSVVDYHIDRTVLSGLENVCDEVVKIDLSSHFFDSKELLTTVHYTNELAWDVTNGYEQAYVSIIEELIEYFVPDYFVVPVGSGETFVGLYEGIRRFKLHTRLIGVGVKKCKSSIADKLSASWTPYKNELARICRHGNRIINVGEAEILDTFNKVKTVLLSEPSAAIVFCLFNHLYFSQDQRVVVINTGKGLVPPVRI